MCATVRSSWDVVESSPVQILNSVKTRVHGSQRADGLWPLLRPAMIDDGGFLAACATNTVMGSNEVRVAGKAGRMALDISLGDHDVRPDAVGELALLRGSDSSRRGDWLSKAWSCLMSCCSLWFAAALCCSETDTESKDGRGPRWGALDIDDCARDVENDGRDAVLSVEAPLC